jgi:hypothetical protein
MATAKDLLPKVVQLSRTRKLQWSPVGSEAFRTKVGSLTLSIQDTPMAFIFGVYDSDGRLLDSASGGTKNDEGALFNIARDAALKVNENLEELQRKLEQLERG